MPEQHMLGQYMPEQHMPEQNMSGQHMPEQHMPEQHMPGQHMPGQENLRGYKKFQDVFHCRNLSFRACSSRRFSPICSIRSSSSEP